MLNSKGKNRAALEGDPFAFVPKEARGCMTNEELEDALRDMRLSPVMEKAVREVCRNGFVIAPELTETAPETDDIDEDDDEYSVDKCLANGDYHRIAFNVFHDVIRVNHLLYSAISRVHRLEGLTAIGCPDIITTNEARMAREKIEAIQNVLDDADDALRRVQLKTDHRTAEERLRDAVFGEGKRKGGKHDVK